jgi:hypothetical protein
MFRILKKYRKKIVRNLTDNGVWLTLKKGTLYLLRSIHENRVYRIYLINMDHYQPLDMNDYHVTFADVISGRTRDALKNRKKNSL